MMPLELSFGQVEAVLAKLNKIADHKRVAFMSRLKHLQKNGCPHRDRPGRGKAGSFSFSQLMQTAIAVDLLQAGLPPALAASIATGNWLAIRPTVYMATYTAADIQEINEKRAETGTEEMDPPVDYLWMISPEALRDMTDEGGFGEFDHYEAMMPVPLEDARRQLESGVTVGVFGEGWRTLVIHGTRLTQTVMATVAYHFRFAEWDAMRDDIRAEMEEDRRRFDDLSQLIREGLTITNDEDRAMLKDRFGTLRDTDFSTNPPTPPGMIYARARELIKRTDEETLAPLLAEEGEEVAMSSMTLQRLLFLRLLQLNDDGTGYEMSTLGSVVNRLLRDRIADRRSRDAMDLDANRLEETNQQKGQKGSDDGDGQEA